MGTRRVGEIEGEVGEGWVANTGTLRTERTSTATMGGRLRERGGRGSLRGGGGRILTSRLYAHWGSSSEKQCGVGPGPKTSMQ